MNTEKSRQKTRMIAWTALFAAITLLLGLTPLGIIPIIPGFIEMTIMCIPVIIGTLTLGLKPGLALAVIFAFCSLITAITRSALGPILLEASVIKTLILIFAPRLLIPVTAYAANKFLPIKKSGVKTAVSAIIGSVTNTVGYLGLLSIFFSDIIGVELFTAAAALNGSIEAAAAVLICTPVVAAVKKTMPAQVTNKP